MNEEFKIGDRVKITATPGQLQYEGIDRASAEYAPGKIGTVVGLDYDLTRVKVDGDEAVSHDGAWYFKSEFLTLVAGKFKVGDRVKITATREQLRSVYINPAAAGQCGVVDYTDLDIGRLTTSVRLDGWDHSCWVEPEWLQLQRVTVTDEPPCCADLPVQSQRLTDAIALIKKLDALQKELASFRFEVSEFGVDTDDPRDGLNAIIVQEVISQ